MAKEKKRCVVTGACGFIGSHMVECLAADGHEIIATDHPKAFESTEKIGRMNVELVKRLASRVVPADLTVPGSMDEVVRDVDYVFHVASVFSYSAPWSLLFKVNVQGTANLIDSIERVCPSLKRLVVWGAGGVYGMPTPENQPFTEETPPNPPNNYQKSKWFQEFLTMERCNRAGIKWTIIRPTTVYGIRQVYGPPQVLKQAYRSAVVMAPANLTARIPFVHVEDVCGAALHLAKYQTGVNSVFNVNDDSQMTLLELFRYLAFLFGKPFIKLPPIPLKPARVLLSGVATVLEPVAKRLGKTPPIERDTVAFFGDDFTYSNEKLKKAGYSFKHPDPKPALAGIAKWYIEHGLI